MNLAIDVGNTSVSVGLFDGTRLVRRERWPTAGFDPATLRYPEARRTVMASVVPSIVAPPSFTVLSAAATRFSFPIEAAPRARVGIDRLVNAEAVWRERGAPALILDCGTATTLSVLHPARGFLGGAIAPGIEGMRQALARGAQLVGPLAEVPLEAPVAAIGPDTARALQSGIVLGYAEMVDGLIRRFRKELDGSLDYPVYATGGNARFLLGVSALVREWDADLTLRGIAYLVEAV